MNLSQTILGLTFKTPLITAAGMWTWTAGQCIEAANAGAGGVTTKSYWNHVHQGNADPVVASEDAWTLNAVGLPDHGPEHSAEQIRTALAGINVPLIVSILGLSAEEYADNAKRVAALKPQMIEVNMSSPTFFKIKGAVYNVDEALDILPAVKKAAGDIPVFVKLSANMPGIGEFASRCVAAGADGITAINTLGMGLAIDLQTRKPILSAKRGGISGPGIKPLAVSCVAEIYQATGGKVPIIGIGGMLKGEDVIEMMLAGASLVGLASAILREGMSAFGRIDAEVKAWMKANNVSDISAIVGDMHKHV